MTKGKLILICQSGGEFITNDDGNLSYEGGEANAVNINQDTSFEDLVIKLAEMSNLDHRTLSIKYFLPGNRRNLITLRNNKDLKRMIDFHGHSVTADIFVNGKEGFDRDAIKIHSSRENVIKLAETVNHVGTPSTAVNTVALDVEPLSAHAIAELDAYAPLHAPTSSAAASDGAADTSSGSQASTASSPSSEHDSDYDSDYKPRVSVAVDANSPSSAGFDTSNSPADAVKKRRRTASWRSGAQRPTVVAVSDNDRRRRSWKKKNQNQIIVSVNDDLEQQRNSVSSIAFFDDDLPEKVVAEWKDCITGVGQDFKSVKEFREALQKFAVAHRFVYKLKKNDTNRASGICVADGCSWKIHASWVPASQSFRIKKFDNSHTCGGESWKNAHPSKNWLVNVIKDKLRNSPHHKPREIAKSISRDFGIELSYTQVWRGIEDAREQLQGSYKESYNRLPWICEKVEETNPGSFAKLITDDEKRLKCLFISFHSCIHGFQNGCRPILFLDATSLRSKYQESLLTATAVDADDGFFPVAFAIVDVENDDNWHWFLEQLKCAISTSQSITFVSDREMGLKESVLKVFENAHHGYSMYHLVESFRRNSKGPFNGEGRGALPGLFLAAGHAARLNGFKKFTEQIREISPNAYDWVIQIEPEQWTSSLFKGEPFNHITQNVAEPYAKLMEEIRESTIMQKIEGLINMVSELINTRRTESSKWTTKLTPSKEKKIQEEAFKAESLQVFMASDILFEVHDESTHVVNIEKWDCTCLEWKECGLPCRHAIASFNSSGKSLYDYCSRHFNVDSYRSTYSESINHIPGIGALVGTEETDSDTMHVLPPPPLSPNPHKEKIKIEDPDKRTVTCSKCKQLGHNKASCKANL
ncbi:MuDR family transposase [Abeliophyllum distichum]|uniref:MuDR family transposase n=1 Tax=Abeliophyllum distichum TaxID=126358 RepID=A0ABD1V6X3_9LAMI